MPGCGKTTIGKKLSEMTDMMFIETDTLIEHHFDLSVSEIFETHGEHRFREVEKEMLKEAMKYENAVISTGGGLPCFFDNLNVIKQNSYSVYPELNVETLITRLANSNNLKKRPLLRNVKEWELKEWITKTLKERESYYLQADLILDDNNTTENNCKSILDHMKNFRG
jgi:shikimate kinase